MECSGGSLHDATAFGKMVLQSCGGSRWPGKAPRALHGTISGTIAHQLRIAVVRTESVQPSVTRIEECFFPEKASAGGENGQLDPDVSGFARIRPAEWIADAPSQACAVQGEFRGQSHCFGPDRIGSGWNFQLTSQADFSGIAVESDSVIPICGEQLTGIDGKYSNKWFNKIRTTKFSR